MTDPTGVAKGLGNLALKVKDKAEQAESNQSTCKILVSILNNSSLKVLVSIDMEINKH